MKIDWVIRPLSDYVTPRPGNNKIIKGKQSDRPGDDLVQGYSASGPDVWVTAADYNQPGIVISAVGARCGKTFFAEGKWTAIANTQVLLPGQDIEPRWLWYRTNDEGFWIRGGTAQPFVKVRETLENPCLIPPLPEQQRIVALLDEAFAGLATTKANAERNLQSAQAVFESHLAATFSQQRDDWAEMSLEAVVDPSCTLSYGIVQPGEDYLDGLPIVRPTDLSAKVIHLDGLKRIDPRLADGYRRTTLQGGELLLCVRGSTGVVSVAAPELRGANVTRGIVPVRFDSALVLPELGYYLMKSEHVQSQISKKTYGAALMQVNIRDLRAIKLFVPSLKEQSFMALTLSRLDAETQHLTHLYERKLAALEELKQSLLQQAFNGEL